MLWAILSGFGIWLLVFLPGAIIGSIFSKYVFRDKPIASACVTQIMFIVSSILVIIFLFRANFEDFGFILDTYYLFISIAISAPIAFALSFLSSYILKYEEFKPPFVPRNVVEWIGISFILAPTGEEIVFRGVFEGYLLLQNTDMYVSIAIPAIIFALIHIVPFAKAPKKVMRIVLINAFILGVLAGYYRAISKSVVSAIAIHSIFNIAGFISEKIHRERRSQRV